MQLDEEGCVIFCIILLLPKQRAVLFYIPQILSQADVFPRQLAVLCCHSRAPLSPSPSPPEGEEKSRRKTTERTKEIYKRTKEMVRPKAGQAHLPLSLLPPPVLLWARHPSHVPSPGVPQKFSDCLGRPLIPEHVPRRRAFGRFHLRASPSPFHSLSL